MNTPFFTEIYSSSGSCWQLVIAETIFFLPLMPLFIEMYLTIFNVDTWWTAVYYGRAVLEEYSVKKEKAAKTFVQAFHKAKIAWTAAKAREIALMIDA